MGEAGLVRTTTSFSLVGHWPTSRCESALALDLSEAEHGNHVRLITDINYNQISNQIFIRDLSTCFFFLLLNDATSKRQLIGRDPSESVPASLLAPQSTFVYSFRSISETGRLQ